MGFDVVCTDCGWKSADACKACAQDTRMAAKAAAAAQIAAPKVLWASDALDNIKTFADPVEQDAAKDALRYELHGVTFGNDSDGILTPTVY